MTARDRAPMLGAAFVGLAAIAATYLSGISFPEQNNIWTLPVVLDFAGSAEGPHDAYHASFVRFVSLFWLAVRPFASEANVATVYLLLQLAGNALLAVTLFGLIRQAAGSTVASALVTAFLCFAFGLWGATRLGYSELFSTYASHTQHAITLCLIGCGLVASRRGGWAGLVIGLAACANLFIGVWGALTAGLALVADERRVASPPQWRFAIGFMVLALLVAGWALAGGGGGGTLPVSFFREQLAGHVYAADYPQAAVQTFALGALVTMALIWSGDEKLRRLGRVTGAAFVVLLVAAIMPYVAEIPILLLLHPLRFASVATLLAAAGAGALLAAALRDGRAALPAFIAVAGFMLKTPVVSLIGLALAIPASQPRARLIGVGVAMVGGLATLLHSPVTGMSAKEPLAFLLVVAVIAAGAWRQWAWRSRRKWADAALVSLVGLLMLTGLVRGATAGFVAAPSPAQRDWAAAQYWVRQNTAPGSIIMPIGVDQGFAMFARRPIWWEQSQMAAALWQPSFLPAWTCRRDALKAAPTPAARLELARREGVSYLLVPASDVRGFPAAAAETIYRNARYAIVRPRGGKPTDRMCSPL